MVTLGSITVLTERMLESNVQVYLNVLVSEQVNSKRLQIVSLELWSCHRPHTYSDSIVQELQSGVEVSEVCVLGKDFVYLPCSYKWTKNF